MKKSHIAILAALGVVVLIILTGLILGRTAVGHARDWVSESGEHSFPKGTTGYEDKTYELEDFTAIVVEGLWEVRVRAGDGYSVDVSIPDSWREGEVFTSGSQLVFGYPVNDIDPEDSATAIVTMPVLDRIEVNGAASVTFDGFNGERLEISIDGAAQLRALNSSADFVSVDLAGAAQVDLEDLVSTDARVALDGLGEVSLNMAGGSLTGRIDGLGRVTYVGTVSNQDVSIDGMGRVRRLD